jgi:hypothetical protein
VFVDAIELQGQGWSVFRVFLICEVLQDKGAKCYSLF